MENSVNMLHPHPHTHAFAHSCKVSWHQIWNNERHLACVDMITSFAHSCKVSWHQIWNNERHLTCVYMITSFAHSCKVSWHQIWNNERHLACVYMITSEKKMGLLWVSAWEGIQETKQLALKLAEHLLSHSWCWRKIMMSRSGHTTVEWLWPARLATGMAAALHHCQWPVLHLLL